MGLMLFVCVCVCVCVFECDTALRNERNYSADDLYSYTKSHIRFNVF